MKSKSKWVKFNIVDLNELKMIIVQYNWFKWIKNEYNSI